MNTVTAYLLSYGYVVCLVAISVLLMKRKILGEEGARKLIHVMLCVTWVLSMRFDNKIHSIIIPLTFVVINYITIKMQLVTLLYREEGDSYGTGSVTLPVTDLKGGCSHD